MNNEITHRRFICRWKHLSSVAEGVMFSSGSCVVRLPDGTTMTHSSIERLTGVIREAQSEVEWVD